MTNLPFTIPPESLSLAMVDTNEDLGPDDSGHFHLSPTQFIDIWHLQQELADVFSPLLRCTNLIQPHFKTRRCSQNSFISFD